MRSIAWSCLRRRLNGGPLNLDKNKEADPKLPFRYTQGSSTSSG